MAKKDTTSVKTAGRKPAGQRAIGRPKNPSESVGRQALIEAACQLLKTTPPSMITRAEVARAANVDPSLIRYYFTTVDSLLIEAANHIRNVYGLQLAERAASQGTDVVSRLRARMISMINLLVEYPYFQRLMAEHILGSDDDRAKAIMRVMMDRGLMGYTQLIEEGVKEGVLRPVDPSLTFLAVIGLAEFHGSAKLINEGGYTEIAEPAKFDDTYRDFVCDLVFNGLLVK